MPILLASSPFIFAEQYLTGTHVTNSEQGILTLNVGYVSHFNANDFYVYSFLFQPVNSKEWHQVPRVDKEDDAKMLFTLQTKHNADTVIFDAKIVSDKHKIFLLTADKDIQPGTIDKGTVTLTDYELIKLDDYERWVFVRKNSRKTNSKLSIEQFLDIESEKVLKKHAEEVS